VTIFLPPLKDRREDVPLLLRHFLTSASRELSKPEIEGISPEALELLNAYDWPGNVRELQSIVRQSVLKATGPVIVPEFLPPEVHGLTPGRELAVDAEGRPEIDLKAFVERRLASNTTDLYAETVEVMERFLFTRVLRETAGNQSRAAEVLGITRGKVRDRIAAFNISVDTNVSIEDG
jgi:DNA-binding NtrC family response regulator